MYTYNNYSANITIVVNLLKCFTGFIIIQLEITSGVYSALNCWFNIWTVKCDTWANFPQLGLSYDTLYSNICLQFSSIYDIVICRQALKTFLESSNMYRPAVVLGKIKDTDLQLECAMVYGKVINWICFV